MKTIASVDEKIKQLTDWRKPLFIQLRALINAVDPKLEEGWKWSTPVWSCNGLVCALAVFKDHVKINFFQGAALADPDKLLNAGFDSKATRAIDFFVTDTVKVAAIKKLIRSAIAYNKK